LHREDALMRVESFWIAERDGSSPGPDCELSNSDLYLIKRVEKKLMSWKSLLTAGLLCVLATPVFAVPTLSVVPGGTQASSRLNANGDWVWRVDITPTGTGSPLGAELGFRETVAASELKSVTVGTTNFDTPNPGTQIFTWEVLTDVDPGAGVNMKPVGVQANCPAGCQINGAAAGVVTGTLDEIFAALGSIDFATAGAKTYLTIVTEGPGTANGHSLQTNLQWLGKYGTGSANGRIAEIVGGVAGNNDTFSGSVGFTAFGGDSDLNGHVDGFDVTPFLLGFQAGTGKWFNGDYTGDGNVNGFDTTELLLGLQNHPGSGAGLVVASSVPEPATLSLLALGLLAWFGRRIRKVA
jgi:PEP-CTERM motif